MGLSDSSVKESSKLLLGLLEANNFTFIEPEVQHC
jgi:hypothetical protein